MRTKIFFIQIMAVVGRNDGNIEFSPDFDNFLVDVILIF